GPGPRGLAWPLALQFALALVGLMGGALLALRWLATGAAAWGTALVALQVLSAAPPALAYLPHAPARALYPDTPALAWLRAHARTDRVLRGRRGRRPPDPHARARPAPGGAAGRLREPAARGAVRRAARGSDRGLRAEPRGHRHRVRRAGGARAHRHLVSRLARRDRWR